MRYEGGISQTPTKPLSYFFAIILNRYWMLYSCFEIFEPDFLLPPKLQDTKIHKRLTFNSLLVNLGLPFHRNQNYSRSRPISVIEIIFGKIC
jgi:hypothetical protein